MFITDLTKIQTTYTGYVRFEFLSTALMKIKHFLRYDALVIGKSYRRFGKSCCLHLQGLSSPRRGIGNYLPIDVTSCLDYLFYVYKVYNNSPIKLNEQKKKKEKNLKYIQHGDLENCLRHTCMLCNSISYGSTRVRCQSVDCV